MADFTRFHNPPRNMKAISYLLQSSSNNPPLNQTKSDTDEGLKSLLNVLQMQYGKAFDHSIAAFLELLLVLDAKGKTAYSTAIHPCLNEAAKLLPNTIAISPNHTLQDARNQGAKNFILSPIHDEIFTLAPKYNKQDDEYFIIDVSLALASKLYSLNHLSEYIPANGFLIEGEIIGLLRGYGAFLEPKQTLFQRSTPIMGLGEAILEACDAYTLHTTDQSPLLWKYLQKEIPNIECFSSKDTLPNTLALRFRNIKARDLITATLHDDMIIANGRRCLFGLGKPSYVLESMGFSDKEQRELISLSFYPTSTEELQRISQVLALRYKQVLSFNQ